jgi:hypothetical protein
MLDCVQSFAGNRPVNKTKKIQPIPNLSQWQSNMVNYGQIHCQEMTDQSLSFDDRLRATYYDGMLVYRQISEFTKNREWLNCVQSAKSVYRDQYVLPNNGLVPAYWNFSQGLTEDFLKSGDETSKDSTLLMSTRATFASDETPLSYTQDALLSREVAYTIVSYLDAAKLGQPKRPRLKELVDQALGHIDQWCVKQTAQYVRPFMVGLTARALIKYYQKKHDRRIVKALSRAADWLWQHTWNQNSLAFSYTDRVVDSGGTEPAPDLNLIVAPMYAFLYHETGQTRFLKRGDLIFKGGVQFAYVQSAKQFNQSYIWSFDYVKWRKARPLK